MSPVRPRVHSSRWLLVLCALLAAATLASGCDDERLDDAERAEVRRILQTGVDLEDDPYVRAETMRVLELVADPSLSDYAAGLVDDSSAMVRVAALRVLLAAGAEDIHRTTLLRFSRAQTDAERVAIIEAVDEYGAAPLRQEITGRAVRSNSPRLRRLGFEMGLARRLERATEAGDTKRLERTLYPEIGRLVDHDDPRLAAAALRSLLDHDQAERAEPLIALLSDEGAAQADRVAAAQVLARARVPAAKQAFGAILADAKIEPKGEFVLPKKINRDLVRWATLGLVATGDDGFVRQAQGYLTKADVTQTVEVIEALAANGSAEALDSVEIAMQDARPKVRYRAIALYGDHPKARIEPLLSALRDADSDTQRRLAGVLATRFPKGFAEHLRGQLKDRGLVPDVLELLRDSIETDAQRKVLVELQDRLLEIAVGEREETASMAAFLLIQLSDEPKIKQIVEKETDPHTRYAYLEHLVRESPRQHVPFFRKNFYSDLYAIRLMSAAGFLRAFAEGGPPRAEAEAEQAEE